MVRVPEVMCIAGKGLDGDRFFEHKEDFKGQLTFFSLQVYESLCEKFQIQDRAPSVFRRNVLVSDADLNALIGEEFDIQGIRFSGSEEATPCYWMNQAFAEGAEMAMRGHGGLRARILSDGVLREES
ncbi:MAG: MOSC domain-containing protein YiiM [Verrucomicrobiales bacterium]|jgi:MOSC domain-containing protein YiiM